MPGYMSGSKKARQTASISNFQQVGIKSGLAPSATGSDLMFRAYNQHGAQQTATVPSTVKGYNAEIAYLFANKLVSVNPSASGGVGRRYPIARLNFN
jgi:hypothetical protein